MLKLFAAIATVFIAFVCSIAFPYSAESAYAEQIQLKVGGADYYYTPLGTDGNWTNKFWVGDSFGYCAVPRKWTPSAGTYTVQTPTPTHNTQSDNVWDVKYLNATTYFGYKGPGFDESIFPSKDWNGKSVSSMGETEKDWFYIVCTHLAISFFYNNSSPQVAKGGGEEFRQWVNKYITGYVDGTLTYDTAMVQDIRKIVNTVPDGFVAIQINGGKDDTQPIIAGRWETGDITLTKASSNTSITKGNSNYSLSGAKYGVYKSKANATANTNRVATMTTNSSGKATATDLTAGTYYVKEYQASPYYQVDSTIYTVTVVAGKTVSVNNGKALPEIPTTPVPPYENSKTDGELGYAQGDATLAGAQFTVKFYYETNTSNQGTAIKTWILEADEDGIVKFDEEHKIGGDSFYYNEGDVVLPIGSISWQETKAPEGYTLDDTIQRFSVTNGTVPTSISTSDNVIRGGIEIQKWDTETKQNTEQGDASFAGVTMRIINRSDASVFVDGKEIAVGDTAYEFELDENGHYKSANDLLPYGTYDVVEVSGSDDGAYTVNSTYKKTITITKNGEIATLTSVSDGPNDQIIRGGFSLQKWDAELDRIEPQGDGNYAGVHITVTNKSDAAVTVNGTSYEPNEICYEFDLPANGRYETANNLLPYGTYELKETSGSDDGAYYTNSEWSKTIQIRQANSIVNVESQADGPNDQVLRGGFDIQKWDAELDRTEPQGDGDYAGVHITVTNRSEHSVQVNGTVYAPGDICFEFDLPANGYYASDSRLLPYGTYEFHETDGSDNGSYYANSEWTQTIQIRTEGKLVSLSTQDKGPNDQVLRGGIAVQKFASEVSDGTINKSTNGVFDSLNLQSTLRLKNETEAESLSYKANDADEFINSIVAITPTAGDKTAVDDDDFGMKNDESQITASDPMSTAQAGAMFKGAEITVYNASQHSVLIPNKGVVEPGGIVAVLVLDANGYASTGDRDLPYGTYTLRETKAPEGYHLNASWEKTVQVREEAKIYEVGDLPEDKTGFSGVDDQVIRGDYKFVKNASDTQDTMEFTPFLLVNLQSGENHVIVTNENGEFYSASYVNGSQYNLHSNNTNANDDAIVWNPDGTYTIDDTKLDNLAGVWFTGYGPLNDPNGVLASRVEPNDNLGALPYGDYALIELNGDANIGYFNIARTFTVSRDQFEINAGTVTDEWQEIEVKTKAHDSVTGDNIGSLSEDTTTIVDEVSFSPNLRAGEEYTFTGILMDKLTNESIKDADGNEITASTTHVVSSDESANGGIVEVTFENIPSDLLRGKTTVVFEDLYSSNGTWVAGHADINDEGQTVYYPTIHTTATDNSTNDHEGNASSSNDVIINDIVSYEGLKPGETYTMTGTLMDKETGDPIDGIEPVSVDFTPDESAGDVVIQFTVPSDKLKGKTTVVFEDCYLGEREVAVHADINDEGQTVSYPEIHTTATDGLDGDKTFSGQQTVTLVDTVEYSNLTPGVEYTMTGTLMDKATGAPLESVESVSQTFTPDSSDGTMEMTFTFDVTDLVGHDVVVFEDCYRDFDANGELADNEKVAQHADINDAGQTVNVLDAGLADILVEDTPLSQTGSDSYKFLIVAGILSMILGGTFLIRKRLSL